MQETVLNPNYYNSAEGSHIQKSGLYLVFNVTAVYEKPCNRTEKEALKTALLCGAWQAAQKCSNHYPKLQEIIFIPYGSLQGACLCGLWICMFVWKQANHGLQLTKIKAFIVW